MATWLHDLLKPHVSRLLVCHPRKNALMRDGNQNDRVDARNVAELRRTHQVQPRGLSWPEMADAAEYPQLGCATPSQLAYTSTSIIWIQAPMLCHRQLPKGEAAASKDRP